MNEDKINPQNLLPDPKKDTISEHPLDMLHTQIETPVQTASTPVSTHTSTPQPEPIPSTTPEPSPTTPEPSPTTPPKVVLQKPIRTYESDVAEALSKQKATVSTIAIAESEKRINNNNTEASQTSSNISRKIFIVLLSLIFILSGLGGGYYLYLKSPLAPQTILKTETKIPSLITPDVQKILSINNVPDNTLISRISNQIQSENITENKIHEFILTQTKASTTIRIGSIDFLQRTEMGMPDTLLRSLKNQWMLGVYSTQENKLPFIVLSIDFFQNTYAGMLKWESIMPDKLSSLLGYRERAISNNSTSTSSVSSYFTIRGKFEDRIVLNRDVREFISDRGELLVLYSFIDKDTLIIATNEAVLRALIEKIEKQTYIR